MSVSKNLILLLLFFIASQTSYAQGTIPIVTSTGLQNGGTEYSLTLQLLGLMTVLTLLPSLVLMMTSFTRIIIVLSLLRQALGTAQTPPNQVLLGIALFLTIFIMSPVYETINEKAIKPYMNDDIVLETALDEAQKPLREFMLKQTREDDIVTFSKLLSDDVTFNTPDDLPLSLLVPAFITSELKSAFTIGFMLYIPFVVIDLVVASILMSMGMMMLSPMMISMPFKLLLFVMVDGWNLLIGSLAGSFA
jgi:flagellar biosynthetic protein FliP